MLYAVRAKSYKRGLMAGVGTERVEIIDTGTNEIFAGVPPDPFDIRARYEHWWNDLNPHSTDVVFVTSVDSIELP
ncbi:hypothetical protein LCGC14_1901860 [marine sediment metagenome]|uniref:Uncharacterized protein n=1 Tax=marine sediment metagenome TaxID=412755 RepID=A0A0F9IA71_9ZZZZ